MCTSRYDHVVISWNNTCLANICFFQDGQALFSELISVAEEQPPKNLKEAHFKIGHRMDLHRFIVPVQARTTRILLFN